jgi:mycothiol synthase
MSGQGFDVWLLDPEQATEDEFAQLNAFDNRMRAEELRDDPPLTLQQTIRGRRGLPQYVQRQEWVVRSPGESEVVATGYIAYNETPENRHVADFWVGVLPEMRRRGIATGLLRRVAEAAQRASRTSLVTYATSSVPAGDAFCRAVGASMVYSNFQSQLQVEDVDPGLIGQWQERGAGLSDEFELGRLEGRYPDSEIEAISRLHGVMNTAPRGELDLEDAAPTPEQLRQTEESLAKRGMERWTIYVRHRKSGDFAGFTEVLWSGEQPSLLHQDNTGVFPEYRNRGLGRWLKAAMIERVIRERPEVRFVRTGNAQSNAPMLRINEELGFKPYLASFRWQVSLDRVLHYLSTRA